MADVNIFLTGGGVSTSTARGMRAVVFVSDLVGYVFSTEVSRSVCFRRTTDGGATWGNQRTLALDSNDAIAFDVWYDRWTPGSSGDRIWIAWFNATNDTITCAEVNTTADLLQARRTVFVGASAVAGRGAFVSITRARSGYLYVAYDLDAGAERGLHQSTDAGVTWSANLSTTFVEATLDTCKLYPASGTGDDNDCWALYYDASALALTLKLWDSSAATAIESATIGVAHTDGATDLTGQYGYDAAVRHSDGHFIVAKQSTRDVAAGTHQVFDLTNTSTITTKTAIAASTDDHYYPQVFIDQSTEAIYVAYNGKRDGSEALDTTTKVYYTKSTDGGTTWSAGDTAYMEGAAGVVQQVWTPQSGLRFYPVWRVGQQLWGNQVNSVSTPAGPAGLSVGGAFVTSTSVVYSPQVITPGAVTVTGATRATSAQLFAGTVSTAAGAQAVTGTTLASGTAINAGTVAPGAVTTTGATIGSGVVVRAGSVTPGAVTLTGATLTSSAVVRAGTVTTTTAVSGATLTSGLVLRTGTVTTTTSVTGTTLASTLALFPGTVSATAAAAVGGTVLASGAILFPGLVTAGAVTVGGASRSSSVQLFAGVVSGVAAPVVADQPFMWLV